MVDTILHLDTDRATALQEAVASGEADSVQDAVDHALDAWLAQRRFEKIGDAALAAIWAEGEASGDAGTLDFAKLKAEARILPFSS